MEEQGQNSWKVKTEETFSEIREQSRFLPQVQTQCFKIRVGLEATVIKGPSGGVPQVGQPLGFVMLVYEIAQGPIFRTNPFNTVK